MNGPMIADPDDFLPLAANNHEIPSMRVFLWICGFATVVLLGALALSSYFIVDRTEFVYVTHFGEHVATLDGETDAGWHWKLPWPIQAVQRLDHRLQVFDLPETEVLTHDPKGRTVNQT